MSPEDGDFRIYINYPNRSLFYFGVPYHYRTYCSAHYRPHIHHGVIIGRDNNLCALSYAISGKEISGYSILIVVQTSVLYVSVRTLLFVRIMHLPDRGLRDVREQRHGLIHRDVREILPVLVLKRTIDRPLQADHLHRAGRPLPEDLPTLKDLRSMNDRLFQADRPLRAEMINRIRK